MKYYLAIDIGASSGRHIIGYKDEHGNIVNQEVYRFPNNVSEVDGHLVWDIERLFVEVKNGIKESLKLFPTIESLSIDTWGVDYVLMNEDVSLSPVFAYRDSRTKEVINKVHETIPFSRLYEITGCQFQEFNTIYQLYHDLVNGRLDNATDFMMIPEYLMYRLTGVKKKELTNAGTTGLLDIANLKVSNEIMEKLKFPKFVCADTYVPGTNVGHLKKEVQEEVGGNILVKLCPTHDTAAAVEGIPMDGNHAYISSGTWSLLGIKTKTPITNELSQKANYSNELGPNYIRYQKNIMGLWIIQCLAREMNLDFPTMVKMAQESDYDEIFDVNDERFLSPKNMKNEIAKYFKEKNIKEPLSDNDFINSTYHSLAFSYKKALEELECITGETHDYLYIVGGGAKNKYLNDLTTYYTNKKVVALPIEATALGNLKSQMEE